VPSGGATVALRWAFPAPRDVTQYTVADSVTMARRFDLIVANPKIFRYDLPQMRAGELGAHRRAVNLHQARTADSQHKGQQHPVKITE
jgi:hypothetical protein